MGDVTEGRKMYEFYSDVHDCEEPHFLSLRDIVLARKQPRKMFVQHNTAIQEGQATYFPFLYIWILVELHWDKYFAIVK